MSDPRHTVDRIRAYIKSGEASAPPEIVNAATDYAQLCREVNGRLRRCGEFLRDDLLCEAISHATARPSALERISILQFPEIAEWLTICSARRLPRPPDLEIDIARQVSAAATRRQPLQDLLARHRYLTLARAPLGERLMALRRLHIAEPYNPVWKADVEAFEEARFATIGNEAAAAIREKNLETIERLLVEVTGHAWLAPLPLDVLEGLPRAADALRREQAQQKLAAMLPDVRDAIASQSIDRCRLVFARWGQVVQSSKVAVPPELVREITPLAQFIDAWDGEIERRREFIASCDMLRHAAAHAMPLEQLTRLYREAARFDLEIPPEVMNEYTAARDAAVKQRADEKRRQFALSASLVIIIAAALAGLVGVMVWMHK